MGGICDQYFFNLVHLKMGQGIFQPAGLPHAYLEGQNVEVMANSDNVLRAGLTDKHIDINELMKNIVFSATRPEILHGYGDDSDRIYSAPAEEFEIHEHRFKEREKISFTCSSGEILFAMDGLIEISTDHNSEIIGRGEALFVCAAENIIVMSKKDSLLFRVSVPVQKTNFH